MENLKEQSDVIGDDFGKIRASWSLFRQTTMQKSDKLIADAMKRVTKDGVITVEEAKGTDTYVEEVTGMQFDQRIFVAVLCDQHREHDHGV